MTKAHNKYPGFIDGLKANNISTNKTSLDVYAKQLEIVFSGLLNNDKFSPVVKSNLAIGKQTIEESEKESNPQELINLYIKVGNLLKSITPSLKQFAVEDLKTLVINYLNIAQYTKDTRVYNLAIDIAKDANV